MRLDIRRFRRRADWRVGSALAALRAAGAAPCRNLYGMTCEAPLRPKFRDLGWVCTGGDLTTLMWVYGLPCVARTVDVGVLMAQPWASAYRPEPFAGGDHYHLVIGQEDFDRCWDSMLSANDPPEGYGVQSNAAWPSVGTASRRSNTALGA